MSKNKNGKTFRIRWLVFAMLVCALISTTTLSSYISTVSGNGTLRIASVEMSGSLDIDMTGLAPGTPKTVTFSVVNSENGVISDVAQAYEISIETTGNLPLAFSLSTVDAPSEGHALTRENNTWSGGAFPHTVQTEHTYNLTISWDPLYNDPKYVDEIDAIRLSVDAQQTD